MNVMASSMLGYSRTYSSTFVNRSVSIVTTIYFWTSSKEYRTTGTTNLCVFFECPFKLFAKIFLVSGTTPEKSPPKLLRYQSPRKHVCGTCRLSSAHTLCAHCLYFAVPHCVENKPVFSEFLLRSKPRRTLQQLMELQLPMKRTKALQKRTKLKLRMKIQQRHQRQPLMQLLLPNQRLLMLQSQPVTKRQHLPLPQNQLQHQHQHQHLICRNCQSVLTSTKQLFPFC